MNKTHLYNILNQYVERYDELNKPEGNNEGYKWKAEACFKENWNIDVDDFQLMFKNAFKEMSNLIDNATVQPIGGISLLLNHTEEIPFVRECFRKLFSEDNGNIDARQNRIMEFIEKINSRIEIYSKGSWKYPQKINNVIYYLNLWKPDENYIFKATEATEWANCVEYGDDFGSGNTFSLKKYYKMCDELLDELRQHKTIMDLYNDRMKSISNFDDKGHILVYDVIYCAKAYNLYQNVPTLQKLSIKQRIKHAETAEKRNFLTKKINDLSLELKNMPVDILLPDVSNEEVTHSKWGVGTIIGCNNGIIEVNFKEGIKKLKYPDSINKYITLENEELTKWFNVFEENKEKRIFLEKELNNAKRELEKYALSN